MPTAGRTPQGAAPGGAPQGDAGPGSRADADRVTTEPIAVVSGSATPQRPAGATGRGGATAPTGASRSADPMRDAVTTDLSGVAVLTEPMPPAAPVGLDADADAAPPTPGDARSARRALAAAARERRRYERQEVRRFTKRSRRRRITWMVVVGSLVALVAVVGVGAYSPLMALRDVRVEGAQRIPAADVQTAFDGVLGTPLPLIDSAEVHAALARFPLIETYSTETIPPGTLVVRIVERTPVGVIDTGSGLELVDAAGVVIDRPDEVPEGQPLIDGRRRHRRVRASARWPRSCAACRRMSGASSSGHGRRRPTTCGSSSSVARASCGGARRSPH